MRDEIQSLRRTCCSNHTEQERDPDDELREAMIAATMARRGCDRAEAEVIMQRIASRLDGYTHAEVAQMHPLPGHA